MVALAVREHLLHRELCSLLVRLPQRLAHLRRAVLQRGDEQHQDVRVLAADDVARVGNLGHNFCGHRLDAVERLVRGVDDRPVVQHDAVVPADDRLVQRVHTQWSTGALLQPVDVRLLVRRVDGEPPKQKPRNIVLSLARHLHLNGATGIGELGSTER